VLTPEAPPRLGRALRSRYTPADVGVLSPAEARRFAPGGSGDPRADIDLAWELLYRLEPDLYDRLVAGERIHPAVLRWLPAAAGRIVEVGAGTGRLTLDLINRGQEVIAIEPVRPLRQILERKLARAQHGYRAQVQYGFLDELPVAADFADLVVACSVLTNPDSGGEAGLAEMERVCRPGGCIALIWPNHVDWLSSRGYQYLSFAGPMSVEFASHQEAVELAEIFYPRAIAEVRRRGLRRVPYEVLGINPPCDVAFKTAG
jgi:SAM-dependent methyltransferase